MDPAAVRAPARLRISLKDMAAQGYAQVLKDYVDEWKLAHDGSLPTAGQMSPTGAVGAAHTWWPQEPLDAHADGLRDLKGSTSSSRPAPGRTFTIVLHQQPLPKWHGQAGTDFPETYTAE